MRLYINNVEMRFDQDAVITKFQEAVLTDYNTTLLITPKGCILVRDASDVMRVAAKPFNPRYPITSSSALMEFILNSPIDFYRGIKAPIVWNRNGYVWHEHDLPKSGWKLATIAEEDIPRLQQALQDRRGDEIVLAWKKIIRSK